MWYRPAIVAVWVVALAWPAAAQQAPRIQAAVERDEVFVGEPFIYQIQLENASSATPPDLSGIGGDFTVEYLGGSQSNSTSIQIINGRRTEVVRREYVLNYRLTARRPGMLEIPSVRVDTGGQTLSTAPVSVRARRPEPVEGFKLEAGLSKEVAYVGEPLVLTTTFYIGRQVQSFGITMPALESGAFAAEPVTPPRRSGREYFALTVNGAEVIAERGSESADGRQYITLVFQHVIVPREAGEVLLDEPVVSLDTPSGQRRSPFEGFSIFGSRDLRRLVVPGNALTLTVRPLPAAGRPADFSGLVGAYELSATATPNSVNVGDPITLTVTLSGPPGLASFELPPLQTQPALSSGFRIPREMAPGRLDGGRKVFTQTLRAESAEVTEIPPIQLSYFDPERGEYAVAATDPIPLVVRQTQVVTAADAEGNQQAVETVAHVAVDAGIAHNFTGAAALRPQRFGPDVWMRTPGSWALLLTPPLLFGAAAAGRLAQRAGGFRAETRRRRQARAKLEAALAGAGDGPDAYTAALDGLRAYLGAHLGLNASALTYADAEGPLRRRGAGEESLAGLRKVFDTCEAHRYAGGATPESATGFFESVRDCVASIEREIGT